MPFFGITKFFRYFFFDIAEYLFCREFKHAAGVVFFQRDVEAGFHQEFAADDFAVKIAGLVVYLHVDFPDAIVLLSIESGQVYTRDNHIIEVFHTMGKEHHAVLGVVGVEERGKVLVVG